MTPTFTLLSCAPETPVAVGEAGPRTVGDLLADSVFIAAALPPASDESAVVLICGDRYHFAAGLLGAWRAGHRVALPPNGQECTVRELASRPGVAALLHDGPGEGLDLRPLLGQGGEAPALAPIDGGRTVAVLYTSGTTGEPQACPKTAGQLLGEAQALVAAFALKPGQRFLATVPPHHIYGLLHAVLVPLVAGGAFVRETPLHAETIAAALRRWDARILVSVPAHLAGLEVLSELPPLARTFSSAAPLSEATARSLRSRFGLAVTEVYGSSETGGIAWRSEPGAPWRPLPGVELGVDVEGRLLLDSPFLPPLRPRPATCADRVAIDGPGSFRLLGRVDRVVKVGGTRLSLEALEQRLLQLDGVRDAAALARPVPGARNVEVCVAAVAPGKSVEAIREGLRAWFEPAALPRRVRVVERLPREENGKLPRRALEALFARRPRGPFVTAFEIEPLEGESGSARYCAEVTVPENLLYFQGHFEGMLILPGIAQLQTLVLGQVRQRWPELGGLRAVHKLKFRAIIRPRERLRLELERAGAKVQFQLSRDGAACSSGALVFASAP